MRRLVPWVLVVSACGGAAPRPEPAAACDAEREEAASAVEARDGCRSTGTEVDDDELAYLVLQRALETHAASLDAGGDANEESVMALADGYWAYLDQIASHFTDHGPLDRAEDAAEALVRDREGDGARTAVRQALEALEGIHTRVSGGEAAEPCAEEEEIVREANEALERCEATASAGESR